jgi:HK97 family phage major capsid protein
VPAAPKVAPQDYVWRSLVCALKAHFSKQSPYQVMRDEYGDDEPTRAVMNVVTKAATVPADTVTSGWASQLVATSIQDFFAALLPMSVYPGLAARGAKFTFGRAGIVTMPTRAATPTLAGSFVAQGSPIPVRQGAFSSISFTPKKMGIISSFTREIAEHSTPAIEGLIRQAIVEDTSVAIDTILLDGTAATTTRPAGLRAGVAAVTATAGGGLTAVIGDIRGLTSALITGTNGNLRAPVWIMNPADVLALSLIPATAGGGEFPFKTELNGGTLQGYPVIQSANVTADMMFLVDAADFVSVTGDTPRFDVSDQAVITMDDTAPAQLGVVGSPNVVAAPSRSLWQTDTIGVRMLLDLNWGLRRTGVVAWTQTMTWN